jgi:hypothetical protein
MLALCCIYNLQIHYQLISSPNKFKSNEMLQCFHPHFKLWRWRVQISDRLPDILAEVLWVSIGEYRFKQATIAYYKQPFTVILPFDDIQT